VAHRGILDAARNQDLGEALERLRPFLTDAGKSFYGQNAKFDWLILARHGLRPPPPSGDPMLASYLQDPDQRHDLDSLSLRRLGHRPIGFKELVDARKGMTFADVGLEKAVEYSGEDSDLALRLSLLLDGELKPEKALYSLYRRIELPVEDLLVSMEQEGIRVDVPLLKRISHELGEKLALLEKGIHAFPEVGEVNLASPRQVGEALFTRLGLPPGRRTSKTKSPSTDSEVLAGLVGLHPAVQLILSHRELSKLKNTYADKLQTAVNPRTGRIHTSFNQTLAVTGRLSSSDPNLQNIPAKTEEGRRIREAFVAERGSVLISADYSQIELRVMAEFSRDKALLKAFADGGDVHRETAARVFGTSPEKVTADERRSAKAINFGIIYGQGPFGLSKALKITQGQARDFISLYFARFPGVKAFMEEAQKEARRWGKVTTLFGRRRFLPNIASKSHALRGEAERMAVNTPIQGTAADLIKIAMLRVDRAFRKAGLKARILLQVHDELIVEAPAHEADRAVSILREEMLLAGSEPFFEGARALKVPLKVDASVSERWSHA
jgi:DNA polymerase-1